MIRSSIILFVLACTFASCKDNKQAAPHPALKQSVAINEPKGEPPTVHPISHATAVLDWGGTTIYIDPVGPAEGFEGFPPPDLILITDVHGDHFSPETLEGLQTQQAKIIVPQAVADMMPDAFAPQLDVLHNGNQKQRFDINVTAVPMYNLREEAKYFHEKGRGNGYVLEKDGLRVYFSGDTEDIPEMRALKDIDMAFVCMNLPYTMPVDKAADAVLAFEPSRVYPYHYRGKEVSNVSEFARLVAQGNGEIEVIQLDWYPEAPY